MSMCESLLYLSLPMLLSLVLIHQTWFAFNESCFLAFIFISFLCRYRRECGRAYPSSPTECPLISFFPFVPNAFSLFLLARWPPPIASSFPAFSFFLSPHLGRLRSLSFSSCRLSFEAHAGHPIEKQGQ